VKCICKKVAYCSKKCLMSDKRYHYKRCPKAGEEQDEDLLKPNE